MALWSEGRGLDEAVRRTDTTLNVLVALLLVAFALAAGSYYYGQMNPRVAPPAINVPASPPVPHAANEIPPPAAQQQP